MNLRIYDIRQAVAEFARQHPAIRRVELFGSRARDDAGEASDVDLLLTIDSGARVSLLDLGQWQTDLEERLGCEVDLLERQAVEASRNPIRRDHILNETLPIYERQR